MRISWSKISMFMTIMASWAFFLLISIWSGGAVSGELSDSLEKNFKTPPASTMPQLVPNAELGLKSEAEIRADLVWRSRVGLAAPDCPEKLARLAFSNSKNAPVKYRSREWRERVRLEAQSAALCGVDLAILPEPGFSGMGGRWVNRSQAGKKLVWSETLIQGGKAFHGQLASPPNIAGPFQNTPIVYEAIKTPTGVDYSYYRDAAVIAYRRIPDALPLPVRIDTGVGQAEPKILANSDLQKEVLSLPANKNQAWVQVTYERPQTIRSAVLGTAAEGFPGFFSGMTGRLEAQREDGSFEHVVDLSINRVPQATASFKPVTAKAFRLSLSYFPTQRSVLKNTPPGTKLDWLYALLPPQLGDFSISKFALYSNGKVNQFEQKAGFLTAQDYYAIATQKEAGNAPVAISDVVDLTAQMSPDGTLIWTPPPGEWVVLRMGYSLTGDLNHIVPKEASGLHVDQLSREHVRNYMQTYLQYFSDLLPPSFSGRNRGIRIIFMESIEMEMQNWTEKMLSEFHTRRGYDPRPWLPVLTGVIVDSADASDRFLWDFRRTIADLVAENFYGEFNKISQEHGFTTQAQALEHTYRPQLGDDMEMRRDVDIPSAAMWMEVPEQGMVDVRGAASVAHIYGRNIIDIESFTSMFAEEHTPRDSKSVADLIFISGGNQIFFFPKHVSRFSAWADGADAWISYLKRCMYMLRQGRYEAQIAYFYGEEAPLVSLAGSNSLDDLPKKYAYDFVNADALINLFNVDDGSLTTPSGMRYRILHLGGTSDKMTVPVLRKLKSLVEQGAIISGAPPTATPSLGDADEEFRDLVRSIWGDGSSTHRLGKGQVIHTPDAEAALDALGVSPAFSFDSSRVDSKIAVVHRTLDSAEIFFVNNRSNLTETLKAKFAVVGKRPELWNAETGEIQQLPYIIENNSTTVPLKLEPWESVFIVFRHQAREKSVSLPELKVAWLAEVSGPWNLRFEGNDAASEPIELERLILWNEYPDAYVKYFSGSGVYTKTFEAPGEWFKKKYSKISIDFGEVNDLAEITLNGQRLGMAWRPPYKIDITRALRPGTNSLEIKVMNKSANYWIGLAQPSASAEDSEKKLPGFSYLGDRAPYLGDLYEADAPLRPSGLGGPVTINVYDLHRPQ